MDADELVDYFDVDGKTTGFCTRTEAETQNLTTPNAIIFVFDKAGNVWLQHRAKTKKHYPDCWDTTACGGVVHGEDILEAARRELAEESNLVCDLHLVETFLNSFPDESGQVTRRRLSHLFVGIATGTPRGNHEVQGFRLFKPGEALSLATTEAERCVPSLALELRKAIAGYAALPA